MQHLPKTMTIYRKGIRRNRHDIDVAARKRNFISAAVLGLAGLCSAGCSEGTESRPPNVIVMCVDVLRADHLGTYGHSRDTSPTVDSLARNGVVFETAISPAAWTKPSVPSYFTGRYPFQHGVYHSSFEAGGKTISDLLPLEETTLAELFKEAGYQTVGVVTNGVIKGRLGFGQGFDDYFDGVGNADKILSQFMEWFESRDSDRPFYSYFHFLDVHLPYDPPEEFRDYFGPVQTSIDFGTDEWKRLKQRIKLGELAITPTDRDAVGKLYDAQLRYTDDTIGRLLEVLKRAEEYDNTLFVFLADHGEELFERGGIGHGSSMHQELIHVPLVFRFPRNQHAGARLATPVSTVDILPTLTDYCGLRIIENVAGLSLMPMLREGAFDPDRTLYSEGIHGSRYQQSVRHGNWKLVVTVPIEGLGQRNAKHFIRAAGLRVQAEVRIDEEGGFRASEVQIQKNQEDPRNKLTGPIESIGDGYIEVLGYRIRVNSDVSIADHQKQPLDLAALVLGTTVKVYCEASSDTELVAVKIRVRDPAKSPKTRLEGPITSVPIKAGSMIIFTLVNRELSVKRTKVLMEGEPDTEIDETEARNTDPWFAAKELHLPVAEQLYNLSRDPGETTNVITEQAEMAAELRARLEELRKPWSRGSIGVELDDDELDHLRELGYIGDEE